MSTQGKANSRNMRSGTSSTTPSTTRAEELEPEKVDAQQARQKDEAEHQNKAEMEKDEGKSVGTEPNEPETDDEVAWFKKSTGYEEWSDWSDSDTELTEEQTRNGEVLETVQFQRCATVNAFLNLVVDEGEDDRSSNDGSASRIGAMSAQLERITSSEGLQAIAGGSRTNVPADVDDKIVQMERRIKEAIKNKNYMVIGKLSIEMGDLVKARVEAGLRSAARNTNTDVNTAESYAEGDMVMISGLFEPVRLLSNLNGKVVQVLPRSEWPAGNGRVGVKLPNGTPVSCKPENMTKVDGAGPGVDPSAHKAPRASVSPELAALRAENKRLRDPTFKAAKSKTVAEKIEENGWIVTSRSKQRVTWSRHKKDKAGRVKSMETKTQIV